MDHSVTMLFEQLKFDTFRNNFLIIQRNSDMWLIMFNRQLMDIPSVKIH